MMKKRPFGTMLVLLVGGAFGLLPLHGGQNATREEKLAAALQKMRDTAKQLVALRVRQYDQGVGGVDGVVAARQKLRDVELRLASDPAERRKILAENVKAAKGTESTVEARVASGEAGPAELLDARLARIAAEIALLEEGG